MQGHTAPADLFRSWVRLPDITPYTLVNTGTRGKSCLHLIIGGDKGETPEQNAIINGAEGNSPLGAEDPDLAGRRILP